MSCLQNPMRVSVATICGITLLALAAQLAHADSITNLLNGKKITAAVACGRAPPGAVGLQLNANGNLVFADPAYGNIVFSGSNASNEYAQFVATADASTITIVTSFTKVPGAKSTFTARIAGNTCAATWTNQGRPLDTSCKATHCAVEASAAQATGCAVLGEPKPVVCFGASAAKDCRCMVVTNTCTRIIVVQYSMIGSNTRTGTLQLGPKQRDDVSACTTSPTESVQYNGWKFN